MIKHYLFIFVVYFLNISVFSQEIAQFRVADFDLRGNVKTCQVITDYGQEIFEFDSLGRLVRATTQYNEDDRDVTSYKFERDNLVEKRVESFKDNVIDLSSSMAYFYTIDTTGNKIIKEQIVSYDKEFVEAQEYQFDTEDRLSRIIVSHENAVDEITIDRTSYKNESTQTYFENGIIQKSVRESTKKHKSKGELNVILTKNYLDGEPNTAEEAIIDSDGLLVSKEVFQYDVAQHEFSPKEKHYYEYDTDGVLKRETIKQGTTTASKDYIFQFDANQEKNWVKKIITPANTFTTRKIEYYSKALADIKEPE